MAGKAILSEKPLTETRLESYNNIGNELKCQKQYRDCKQKSTLVTKPYLFISQPAASFPSHSPLSLSHFILSPFSLFFVLKKLNQTEMAEPLISLLLERITMVLFQQVTNYFYITCQKKIGLFFLLYKKNKINQKQRISF